MSSESRYLYHQPPQPAMPASYEYASYPPPPYESGQIPPSQPSMRPMRNTAPQAQQPSSFPNPYPTTYPPTFALGPSHSWPNEPWTQYPPSFSPAAPVPDVAFNSGTARPESGQTPDSRSFSATQPQTEPRHHEERPSAPVAPPPPLKTRRRGPMYSTQPQNASSSSLDFAKLSETYRLLLDTAGGSSVTGPAKPPTPGIALERMLQLASEGVQTFEIAVSKPPVAWIPSESPEAPSSEERETTEPKVETANGAVASKKQKTEEPTQDGQIICLGCNATSTPEWRRGPLGPRTLCNACGLVYAKLVKKRVKEGGRAFGNSNGKARMASHAHGESSVQSSDSDGDEDSAGSRDMHSD